MQTMTTRWINVTKTSKCKFCGAEIFFQKSYRTGKWYVTDVYTVPGTTEKFTGSNHFHTCQKSLTNEQLIDKDIQAKNAYGEAERRQERHAYETEMELEIEQEMKVEEAEVVDLAKVRASLTNKTFVKSVRSGYYDTSYYSYTVNGPIDINLIYEALNEVNRGQAYRYGCFGGYTSFGQVTKINNNTIMVEEVYHVGD